jgi:hypothetical protein
MTTFAQFQSRTEATIQATLPGMATTEGHAKPSQDRRIACCAPPLIGELVGRVAQIEEFLWTLCSSDEFLDGLNGPAQSLFLSFGERRPAKK